MRPLLLPLGLTALLCSLPALAPADNSMPQLPAPEGAQVYFITPQDGASVGQTFTVRFGLKGMGVAPAGVDVPATGHHHLLVDVATLQRWMRRCRRPNRFCISARARRKPS